MTSTEIGAAVDAEIARFAADGPTEAELARARNTHLADFYKGLDHLQTRADLLNHYQNLLGDPDGVGRDVGRYADATCASVRDTFARASGRQAPGAADAPRTGDRVIEAPAAMTSAPAVGPLPSVVPPHADRFTLSNGLEVVTVRREVAPIVSAALMIRSGAGNDAAGAVGPGLADRGDARRGGRRRATPSPWPTSWSAWAPICGWGAAATDRSFRSRRRTTPSSRRWTSRATCWCARA